jgi:hypothetical protein
MFKVLCSYAMTDQVLSTQQPSFFKLHHSVKPQKHKKQ